ncbi:5-carboxymethyl-2-hydroxymuconate Delta-isomerase [Algoriphagus lutimaris]|uniref:5-carboxymethyl-2-hydroxymuconate Delta-isomerase n=1 Tax=Algoriphagus lutimaris TaxID=613197 RepID=UPI00196AF3AD|nr:5-carboxymethyl-2-hydroxymuconate Delta-isomerase [Algoriphagus lutimaris]MBN3520240.1 5-carboxymethyl-2-hydroxymuconate Delta-isomerase [Algoriphagus lutimaris]
MPHFIIECSDVLLDKHSSEKIMKKVYEAAISSNLFKPEEIKVRIRPYRNFYGTFSPIEFIHVFGNIMEGRNQVQKNTLSKNIVTGLNQLFPEVSIISMNIRDFDRTGYFNKQMLP